MIIDMKQQKIKKFAEIANKIKDDPAFYLQFDSVSDFYKADWLAEFPHGTTWVCSGLDDGAEDFYAVIQLYDHCLYLDCGQHIDVQYRVD